MGGKDTHNVQAQGEQRETAGSRKKVLLKIKPNRGEKVQSRDGSLHLLEYQDSGIHWGQLRGTTHQVLVMMEGQKVGLLWVDWR